MRGPGAEGRVAGHRDVDRRRIPRCDSREVRRRAADNRAVTGRHLHDLPEHVCAPGVPRLPISVADHGDIRASGCRVFRRREIAAENWRGVEEFEEARADGIDRLLASLFADSDHHGRRRLRGEIRKGRGHLSEVEIPGVRHDDVCRPPRERRLQVHHPHRVRLLHVRRSAEHEPVGIKPNIAAFAPMPRPRVTTTAAVKPGERRSPRSV